VAKQDLTPGFFEKVNLTPFLDFRETGVVLVDPWRG
jgi:hypothetical protein